MESDQASSYSPPISPLPSPPTSPLSDSFATRALPGFEETFDTSEHITLRGDTFGGPSYDVDQESWIRHHPIEDDDLLTPIDRRHLAIMPSWHPKHNDRFYFESEILPKVMHLSKSSGRIYVRWIRRGRKKAMDLSGVWLEQGYFLTNALWYQEEDYVTGSGPKPLQNMFESMMKPPENKGQWTTFVSTADYCPGSRSYAGTRKDWLVVLHSIDRAADLAVFKALPKADGTMPPNAITLNDLLPFSHLPRQYTRVPIWTIVYSCRDADFREPPEGTTSFGLEFLDSRDPEEKARVMSSEPEPLTVFEYMRNNYIYWASKNTQRAISVKGDLAASYEQIFVQEHKALGIGNVIAKDDIELQHLSIAKNTTYTTGNIQKNQNLTEARLHTISGFYGCSGAMMVAWQNSDEELVPKIVGLYLGAVSNTPANEMAAFTEAGIQWIQARTQCSEPFSITEMVRHGRSSKGKEGSVKPVAA